MAPPVWYVVYFWWIIGKLTNLRRRLPVVRGYYTWANMESDLLVTRAAAMAALDALELRSDDGGVEIARSHLYHVLAR